MSDNKIKVGISQGDINGVGLEVIIKTFNNPQMLELCTPILYGSNKTASFHRKALQIESFSFNQIKNASEANAKRANIVNVEDEVPIDLGQQTEQGGKSALASLEAAAYALAKNEVDVLVTAPINKENIQSPEFAFPGHTEYLQDKFGDENTDTTMFMISDNLRIAVATGHIPVTQVADSLSTEKILI